MGRTPYVLKISNGTLHSLFNLKKELFIYFVKKLMGNSVLILLVAICNFVVLICQQKICSTDLCGQVPINIFFFMAFLFYQSPT